MKSRGDNYADTGGGGITQKSMYAVTGGMTKKTLQGDRFLFGEFIFRQLPAAEVVVDRYI